MTTVEEICAIAPVIPVITVTDASQAVPLAEALVAGGLKALEVTLRTPAALDAIRAMRGVAGAVVGAGTILTPDDLAVARAAGAEFGVSPGSTPALVAAVRESGLPFLPGCATASEAMALAGQGFSVLKFFPAGPAGGTGYLKALSAPLPAISFCPTGGVGPENAADYLSLPNVRVVGGSWVAPGSLVASGDWAGIEALARQAVERLSPLQRQ